VRNGFPKLKISARCVPCVLSGRVMVCSPTSTRQLTPREGPEPSCRSDDVQYICNVQPVVPFRLTEVPAIGYTVPYAIGNILLTAWGPAFGALMSRTG
jgi:hypothetical protein